MVASHRLKTCKALASAIGLLCVYLPAQTLRSEATPAHLLIGTAARSYLLSETRYAATLAAEFNMLEPEDELKWEVLRARPDGFDFVRGDRLVEFASEHGMKVRGHTLVWGRHLPPWVAQQTPTQERLRELLQAHIQEVVSHYRGKVFAWDVVNEAFDEQGHLRSSLWFDSPGIGLGPAYIEQALRWSHSADPGALLFLNDADCEEIDPKSDAIYSLAKDFKRRGVPLDGIGLQMHIFDLHRDFESIARNLRRFGALGLQVHITEMDVALPVDSEGRPRIPTDLIRQAEIYRRVSEICVAEPACTAIQVWGFTDKYSWVPWFTGRTKGAALLFDADYAPKPAFKAILDSLLRADPHF